MEKLKLDDVPVLLTVTSKVREAPGARSMGETEVGPVMEWPASTLKVEATLRSRVAPELMTVTLSVRVLPEPVRL